MTLLPETPDDASNDQEPIVIPVDSLVHNDDHPFCYEDDCDCHEDQSAIEEVNFYYQEGLISADDATRIVQGKTL